MKRQLRNLVFIVAAPAFSAVLLAGMIAEKRTYITREDAAPYHARAKEAILSVPKVTGYWTGKDNDDIPAAAIKLLRPNVILSRTYVDNHPERYRNHYREVNLLIVQCFDSRDMLGHYPPVCYPAHGDTEIAEARKPRDWRVGDLTITGMEYHFERKSPFGQTYRQAVYNFLIVPNQGIFRDMDGVSAAAENYQQRYFGAAQFQFVMDADLPQHLRDEALVEILGADPSIIKTVEQIQ